MQKYLVTPVDERLFDMQKTWEMIRQDDQIAQCLRSRKWSLLVPDFQEMIGSVIPIAPCPHPYSVLAVDGSQIYYDKHQGPACYLVNTGSVLLRYGIDKSSVVFDSQPELVVATGQETIDMGTESINLYREQQELQTAVSKSIEFIKAGDAPFLCMLDGSMIFFQIDLQAQGQQRNFFAQFMNYFDQLYQHRILHVAYMSFPRTKDLLNVLRIAQANYCQTKIAQTENWYKFSDMDVAQLFLTPGTRSIVFCSKAPVSYAYPAHLKPYFCYVNAGLEIVRLEFPWWIASNNLLVDQVCGMVLSQIEKGRGYPVALFEAHEQAVVKAAEREFFYDSLRRLYIQNAQMYQRSRKSAKKVQVPI